MATLTDDNAEDSDLDKSFGPVISRTVHKFSLHCLPSDEVFHIAPIVSHFVGLVTTCCQEQRGFFRR